MSDILIKGMEMPEDSDMIVIYSDGTAIPAEEVSGNSGELENKP